MLTPAPLFVLALASHLHIVGKNVCAFGHPSEFIEAINFVVVVCGG